jgi:predicted membrane protein
VLAGFYLLKGSSAAGNKVIKTGDNGDTINVLALFSGSSNQVGSQNFNGGQITAIFGGADVDLSQAKTKQAEIDLSVTALFGGADLLVGDGWRVEVHGTPLFGGIDDKRQKQLFVSDEKPLLKINATVLFGGIDIK